MMQDNLPSQGDHSGQRPSQQSAVSVLGPEDYVCLFVALYHPNKHSDESKE
jgi:hypothetical protein